MQRNVTIIAIHLMFKNEYRVRSLNRRLYHSATAEGVVHRNICTYTGTFIRRNKVDTSSHLYEIR